MNAGKAGLFLGVLALSGVAVLHVRVERLVDQARAARCGQRLRVPPQPLAERTRWREQHGETRMLPACVRTTTSEDTLATRRGPEPDDELGDIIVLTCSPENGDQLDVESLPKLVFTVEDVEGLEGELELTPAQARRVKEVVDRTNRWIEDILALPGPEGKSPRSVAEERRKLAKELVPDHAKEFLFVSVKPVGYRSWSIPGRDYTYGDEVDRIMSEAHEQIRRLLNDEQRKKSESLEFSFFKAEP